MDLSEKKSTGITKILNALKANGSPPPLFETDEDRSAMFATIYLHKGFEPIVSGSYNEHVNEHVYEHVYEHVTSIVGEQASAYIVKPVIDIDTTTKVIFSAIKKKPRITNEELTKITGKSRATVTRSIKKLREARLIYRKGSDKDGSWALTIR
jgi:ATP-dependent DNA helicase RecG